MKFNNKNKEDIKKIDGIISWSESSGSDEEILFENNMENFLQNIKKYNYKDKDNNKSNKH